MLIPVKSIHRSSGINIYYGSSLETFGTKDPKMDDDNIAKLKVSLSFLCRVYFAQLMILTFLIAYVEIKFLKFLLQILQYAAQMNELK
jgi:hypothetical protein